MNWLGDGALADEAGQGFACFAKVRSTRPPTEAMLHADENGIYVDLMTGEAGVAPGQACVLYSAPGADARVYGGGFIERSERSVDAEASLKALWKSRLLPETIRFSPPCGKRIFARHALDTLGSGTL